MIVVLMLAACTNPSTETAKDTDGANVAHVETKNDAVAAAGATYVGSATCGECHQQELDIWSDSAHAWAMRPSTPETVLGAFDGQTIKFGETSTARTSLTGTDLVVDVAERDGESKRYPLRYYLGRATLEQHLAQFPNGRLQALPVAFDVTKRDWFDVFAGEQREADDWGHWTNLGMTANSQCLFCHTTGYEKRYDAASDSYDTRWAEMAVGCEACHGPGSRHVQSMRSGDAGTPDYALATDLMLDACASCHALRREIWPGFHAGAAFLDHFDPALLDEGEFHPDGQVLGESYEWASFLQSRMYREGVRCGDCHEPHGAKLRAEGDTLCLTCHQASFAAEQHTHHAADAGTQCVSCHMAEKVFMARDRRRDHSFSIPDPGLSAELDAPNACAACHADRATEWAVDIVASWAPASSARERRAKHARMIARATAGEPQIEGDLIECTTKCEDPIRRASAAKLLALYVDRPGVTEALLAALTSPDALLRGSAAWALGDVNTTTPTLRSALLAAIKDPVRNVRLNAAWALRGVPFDALVAEQSDVLLAAFQAWETSAKEADDDPQILHNLGILRSARGQNEGAIAAYRAAVKLNPGALAPRNNLAMLLVRLGRNDEAAKEFDTILAIEPTFAPAAYAMGLYHGENGRWREAVAALTNCLKAAPNYPGALGALAHAYVELDQGDLANHVLQAALEFPGAREEALAALLSVNLELGRTEDARRWAKVAQEEMPELAADERVRALLAEP